MAQYQSNGQAGLVPQNNTIFDVVILGTPSGNVVNNSNPLPVIFDSNTINLELSNNITIDVMPPLTFAVGSNQIGNVSITQMPGIWSGSNQIGNVSITALPAITYQTGSVVSTNQISVAVTATQLFGAATSVKKVVYNNSTNTVYLGNSSVTTSTGYPLTSNNHFDFSHYTGSLFGIVASGTSGVGVIVF